jgi:hypothetical protein
VAHRAAFVPQRVGNDFELFVGRLGHIQQQPFSAPYDAMPAAIAAKPILPNFVS